MKRSELFYKFITQYQIRAQTLKLVPLRFVPTQRQIWEKIEKRLDERKKIWFITLKARRTGISTLCQALMLTRAILDDRVNSLVMASNSDNSKEIWRMASTMIDHSPWKSYVVKTRREITIGESRHLVQTAATPDAVRGFDLTCLHASELGFWERPETLLAALQCLPDVIDTFCFIESTANGKTGIGSLFYQEWERAVQGESDFIPIFLPWHMFARYRRHGWIFPEQVVAGRRHGPVLEELNEEERMLRDSLYLDAEQLAWRRWAIATKAQGNLDHFNAEYPSTPEVAFIQSGLPFFRAHELYPFREQLRKGERFIVRDLTLVPDPKGYVEVFEKPRPGRQYLIGSDSSMGMDSRTHSRSAGEVIDMATMTQVAEYDATTPPHVQARHLAALGKYFNMALVAPEVQSSGGGGGREIIVYLKDLEYPNIYIDTARSADHLRRSKGLIYGWETNSRTRPRMLARLREVVCERSITIRSERLLNQMASFGENDSHRFEALSGHDDLLIAFMIALVVRADQYVAPAFAAKYRTVPDEPDWAALGLNIRPEYDPATVIARHKKEVWSRPRRYRSLGEAPPPIEEVGYGAKSYMEC